MTARRYIFAGGGTGGHLYPGLAVWREIQSLDPDASVLFVCSGKPLDAEVLAREGVGFLPVPAKPFGVRPLTLIRFLKAWGPSVRASRDAIRQAPSIVVAMGGYVAAPAVQAGRAERVPRVLVNLDAVPGKANMWIARHAGHRLTAADSTRVPSSWERVPPIVRPGALCSVSAQDARSAMGLDPDRPTLVVTGGSLGAGSLNRFVTAFATRHAGALRAGRWQVLHQTGKGESEEASAIHAYRAAGVDAAVRPFLTDMAGAWGAATLAVARCGANTVAELWANHVPSLLLPYPYHKDEHQKHNAEPLRACGGALIHKDHIDPEANMGDAGAALLGLIESPSRIESMRKALQALGPADGATRVARMLVDAPPH